MADLEEAIRKAEQAVDATPEGHPDPAGHLNNLGNKLWRRFKQIGVIEDLDEAIGRAEQALDAVSKDDPNLAARLTGITTERQRCTGRPVKGTRQYCGCC
jgi:hypothetical protein